MNSASAAFFIVDRLRKTPARISIIRGELRGSMPGDGDSSRELLMAPLIEHSRSKRWVTLPRSVAEQLHLEWRGRSR